MKKHSLLFTLLLALMVPMAAIGQGSLPFNQNFNSGTTLPNGWSNFVQQGSGTSIIVNSRLALVCTAVPENNPRIAIFGVRIPSNNTGDNVMHLAFDYSGDQGVIIGYVQSNAFHTIQSYDVTNGITSKTLQVAFPTNARLAFITGATGVTGIDPDTQRPSSNFATIDNVSITSVRPTNLVASNIDDNSATITWNANNASKWEVQYKPSSASDWMNVSGTLITNTCLLSNLSAGTSYDVRVKTKANSGNYYTDWSSVYTFNTVACAAPTNLTVSNITSNSATVNWESTGTWFHYQYRESGGEWIEDGGNGGTGNTFASLTEVLEPNTTYEFRVQNICNLEPLEESSYATTQFTTETIPCSAPTGLTVSNITATGATFAWNAEEGEVFEYFMRPLPYTYNEEHFILDGNDGPYYGPYTYPVSFDPDTDNIFYLRKKCGENVFSEPVSVTFHTIPTCPSPTGLHIDDLTAHSVRIEWDAEEGAMFQEVFNTMSFDPNTPPTDWGNYTDYDNFAEWDGLAPEQFYGIWVRKYCSETDQSEPIYITFTTPEACPAPTGLTVSNITSTGASFSWDAEAGATFEYFTIGDPWEGFEPALDQNWTSTPYNTAGWTNAFPPNSVQRFYLRKNCGDDGYSEYTYVEFRTLCGPMSLSNGYSEDFNNFTNVSTNEYDTPTGYPDVDLPHCWQFLNRSESAEGYPQAFLSSNSEYAVSGNCLFFKSSSTTPLYAILPEFVQDIAEYQLTFTYCNENVNENNGTLYVGYMTDPSDANTFVETMACAQTRAKTTVTAYFPNAPQGSFMAFKYVGGLYDNYYLGIDDVVVTTGPSCFPTGTLDCVGLSSRTATLSWQLIDSQQNAWVVEYSKSNQFFDPVYTVDATQNWNFVIENLEPLTTYYARVRGNCGDGSWSDVSNTIIFTTLDACPVPTNLVASNLTQNTADLSWTGSEDVESYFVKWHRTAQVVGINEQFDEELLAPDRWEVKTGLLSEIINGGELGREESPHWNFGTKNGVFDSHAYLEVWNTSCKSWLITPRHTVQASDIFTFDLALTAYSGNASSPQTTGADDRFVVLITLDNCNTWSILREWNNSDSQYVYNNIAHTATGEQVSIDLYDYVDYDVRIAFYAESTVFNADNNLHIDNVTIGTNYGAGGESQQQVEGTALTIPYLDAGTEYEVQVRSACSNPEVWSEPITFKTLDAYTKVFVGGQAFGNFTAEQVGDQWSNPNNWVPNGMPGSFDGNPLQDVIIRHDVVISDALGNHIIANANSITFEGTPKPTLTLMEGSQLRLNTNIDEQNQVTVKKNITGYTGAKDHYYLISVPAHKSGSLNASISGLVTTDSEYDLYDFDPTKELEWRNYKEESFSLYQGEGHLYANAADVELSFTGEIRNNKERYTIINNQYYPNADYSFNGWELCGNTFTCNAYLSTESQTMAFYRMNAEGTGFEVATDAIKPMEGFFLQNTVNDESVVLSRTAPDRGVRCLNLVLSQVAALRDGVSTGSTTLDNAIIRFDEGNTLEKLMFREGSSKIYMTVEGKDYAVVNASQKGELPINFKAESNGSYTLSFTNEDVEFSYLHLIDNLTGEDVDLKSGASTGSAAYTFDARTTDDVNRFMLMYATDGNTQNGFVAMDAASANLRDQVPVLPLLPPHVLETHQDASPMTIAIGLYPGWNWIAPTVEVDVEAMQNEFGSDTVICEEENTSIITPGQMVKVHVDEEGMYDLTGRVATASITIEAGTNWIGYTGVQNTAISAALATYGITPQNGDKIISQDGGFAIFNGTTWEGTLTQLTQGQGYVYVRY